MARRHAFILALLLLGASLGPVLPTAAAGQASPPPAIRTAMAHSVFVSIRFQKNLEAEEHGAVAPDPRSLGEGFRTWRMTQVVPGFVIHDHHTVLISDPWIAPGAIAEIRIRTRDGFVCEGTFHGFLADAEGALIRTDEAIPVLPVTFSDAAGPAHHAASIREGPDGAEAWVEDLTLLQRRSLDGSGGTGYGTGDDLRGYEGVGGGDDEGQRTVDLVCDAGGRPVGFRFGSSLSTDGRWRGEHILSSAIVQLDDLDALEAQAQATSPSHRLTVTFRVRSRHDQSRDPFSFSGRGTAEEEYWGLALAPDMLVVPASLGEEQVRRILSVRLDDVDGEGITASYAGRLRGYDAFLVKVEGVALACVPNDAVEPPATGGALLTHRVARRGGERRDQVEYDRVLGRGRGYGDRLFLMTERKVAEGTVLRDVEGRILGFAARLDPEDRERRLGDRQRPGRGASRFPVVAVLFYEEGCPTALVSQVDTRVMPQEETDARRLPWLGVEYDGVDEGVAELLDVSAATRDGRRGLLVVAVYDGSPAERIGITTGDILLSARRTSGPGGPPIDLRDDGGASMGLPPGLFGLGRGAPAPWRSRENALVRLLRDWGVDATLELVWLRSGEEHTTTLSIETAPPDFSSAGRVFDEDAGLEVRDLTYEIRHVLRMPTGAPGVVVGRTEEGTPAAQARIEANELVLEVDGVPIESAEAFRTALTTAREAGRKQVRLVVRRLGKTRLVDLSLGERQIPSSAPETNESEDAGS